MLSNVSFISADIFQHFFIKIIFQDNISVPNRSDPDQTQRSDHGPLTKLFETTKLVPSRQRVVLTKNTVSSFACVYGNIF